MTVEQWNHRTDSTTHKTCVKCQITKPVSEFSISKRKSGKRIIRSRCKPCAKEYDLTFYEKLKRENPLTYPRIIENRHMLHRYGITLEYREKLYAEQRGTCAICEKPKKLTVDHCHGSKKVRGLLCGDCNRGLGLFFDNTKALESAIRYLVKFKDQKNECSAASL